MYCNRHVTKPDTCDDTFEMACMACTVPGAQPASEIRLGHHSIESHLQPTHMNQQYTWKQIEDAIKQQGTPRMAKINNIYELSLNVQEADLLKSILVSATESFDTADMNVLKEIIEILPYSDIDDDNSYDVAQAKLERTNKSSATHGGSDYVFNTDKWEKPNRPKRQTFDANNGGWQTPDEDASLNDVFSKS